MNGYDYHQDLFSAINEFKTGHIDKAADLFYDRYKQFPDYGSVHNYGVFVFYENDFVISHHITDDETTPCALKLLLDAEKIKPGREKNALALSLCHHLHGDFQISLNSLSESTPIYLKTEFMWMTAVNHISLSKYQKALDILHNITESCPDLHYQFWPLYAIIQCKQMMHQSLQREFLSFRKCVQYLHYLAKSAKGPLLFDIIDMLTYAVPVILLFGRNQDYRWISSKLNDIPMTDVDKQLLYTQADQYKEMVKQEFFDTELAKMIVFDLFEYD